MKFQFVLVLIGSHPKFSWIGSVPIFNNCPNVWNIDVLCHFTP
jgi:hypothetical protein